MSNSSFRKQSVKVLNIILVYIYKKNFRGFWPLLRFYQKISGQLGLVITTRFGSYMQLIPSDYIDSHILREGYYESEIMEALLPFLGKDTVFWDVGANIGIHSVTAKYLRPETIVVAFEPNPLMVERIRSNCELNQLQIQIVELGLSKQSENAHLSLIKQGNPGMSTLHPWCGATYDSIIEIRCASADDLVRKGSCPSPTVIKIDVEGGEADVIAGLGNLLYLPSLTALIFEAEGILEKAGNEHTIVSQLHSAGFRIKSLRRKEDTAHNLENYLATRS